MALYVYGFLTPNEAKIKQEYGHINGEGERLIFEEQESILFQLVNHFCSYTKREI